MALPVGQQRADLVYNQLDDAGTNVQSLANSVQAEITAGTVSLNDLLNLLNGCVALLAQSQAVAANPVLVGNLVAWANMINPGGGLTSTSMQASMTALAELIAAIAAEYPQDAMGHMLDRILSPTGAISWGTAPAGNLPKSTAALSAWLATV